MHWSAKPDVWKISRDFGFQQAAMVLKSDLTQRRPGQHFNQGNKFYAQDIEVGMPYPEISPTEFWRPAPVCLPALPNRAQKKTVDRGADRCEHTDKLVSVYR
jgi:hypothetical protein